MRRTKIVCSLGPASSSPSVLQELVEAGMDVARLNCSHGDWSTRRATIRELRRIAAERGRPVAVLLDLAGPKFRLGELPGGRLEVFRGQKLTLAIEPAGDGLEFPLPEVIEAAEPGDRILVGDGCVSFVVQSRERNFLVVTVADEGELRSRQGVTLVGRDIPVSAITPQDVFDIRTGADEGVDWFGVSFVRSPDDIKTARTLARESGSSAGVIAKIETTHAVERLSEIVEEADGVMIARGDLGLQVPLSEVPHLQQRIIAICRESGTPVVTATQMLETMVENERPTRAEVSDVANAILQGTDAVMLSGETAVGRHPALVVRTMAEIVERAEKEFVFGPDPSFCGTTDHTTGVARAACTLARCLEIPAIIGFTRSGATAKRLSMHRPTARIVAASPSEEVLRRLCLVWGVIPVHTEMADTIEEMIATAYRAAISRGYLAAGDLVVITAGMPPVKRGDTNLIYVAEVSEGGSEA